MLEAVSAIRILYVLNSELVTKPDRARQSREDTSESKF